MTRRLSRCVCLLTLLTLCAHAEVSLPKTPLYNAAGLPASTFTSFQPASTP
jgi:hypothetical protein